jgi:hypothetical protein
VITLNPSSTVLRMNMGAGKDGVTGLTIKNNHMLLIFLLILGVITYYKYFITNIVCNKIIALLSIS